MKRLSATNLSSENNILTECMLQSSSCRVKVIMKKCETEMDDWKSLVAGPLHVMRIKAGMED